MKTQNLSIDLLRIDGGTQSRLAINEEVVNDYAELIAESKEWPFPPLDVFHDGTDYYVADGFHRKLGAVQAKRASVPCNVHEGTATAARIFGMTANDRHGLRMTRADKRACVEWLLDNPPKRTQAEIAELAGVSVRTVRQLVADRNAESLQGKLKPSKQDSKRQSASNTPKSGSSETEPRASIPTSPPPASPSATVPTSAVDDGACDGSGGGGDDPLYFPEGPVAEVDEPGDLGAPADWQDEKPEAPKKPAKAVKALEGREADAFDARQSINGMMKTIDQWMRNVNWTVDRIRNEFPTKAGDEVLKHLQATYDAMKKWERGVK